MEDDFEIVNIHRIYPPVKIEVMKEGTKKVPKNNELPPRINKCDKSLERYTYEIIFRGSKVIAKAYLRGLLVKTSVISCHHTDEFNLTTGVMGALMPLFRNKK